MADYDISNDEGSTSRPHKDIEVNDDFTDKEMENKETHYPTNSLADPEKWRDLCRRMRTLKEDLEEEVYESTNKLVNLGNAVGQLFDTTDPDRAYAMRIKIPNIPFFLDQYAEQLESGHEGRILDALQEMRGLETALDLAITHSTDTLTEKLTRVKATILEALQD